MMHRGSPRSRQWLSLALLATLATGACGGSPLSPDELASLLTTDTFTGTIVVGATVTHPFVVKRAGDVTLTLTTLTPADAGAVGLGLGSWDGTTCTVQISTDQATVGTAYAATVSGAGNFCVVLVDGGALTADANYAVTVRHP